MSFQFKQFFIQDDRCAMKVGTDSILLGSWVALDSVRCVLDMGCGCGILSLMLAQRLQTQPHFAISAVDIEPNACAQARENATQSPWAAQIAVHQGDVTTYCAHADRTFDLIVANPPYFPLGVACANARRQTARYIGHSALTSHLDWLLCAKQCLAPNGRIALVLPFHAGLDLIDAACAHGLFNHARLDVATTAGKAPQRMLLSFSERQSTCAHHNLTIHDNGNYSADYRQLTRAFYLRF